MFWNIVSPLMLLALCAVVFGATLYGTILGVVLLVAMLGYFSIKLIERQMAKAQDKKPEDMDKAYMLNIYAHITALALLALIIFGG